MSGNLLASELALTQEEQQYLSQKVVLSLCVEPDWLPYEQLDAQEDHSQMRQAGLQSN